MKKKHIKKKKKLVSVSLQSSLFCFGQLTNLRADIYQIIPRVKH